MPSISTAVLVAAIALFSQLAQAALPRSFVSIHGNDANPCTSVSPCRTLSAAYALTNAGGEILAVDSGGYGAVTLSKSIVLTAAPGVHAAITTSGDAIRIDAANALVVVRNWNLILTSASAVGVRVASAAAGSTVELSKIDVVNPAPVGGVGILQESASRVLVVDSAVRGLQSGYKAETAAGVALMTIERSRAQECYFGFYAGGNSYMVARDATAFGRAKSNNNGSYAGFVGLGTPQGGAKLICERCLATNNLLGIASGPINTGGPSTVRVSDSTVFNNAGGVIAAGGDIITSFGNNRIQDNDDIYGNGSFASTKAPY